MRFRNDNLSDANSTRLANFDKWQIANNNSRRPTSSNNRQPSTYYNCDNLSIIEKELQWTAYLKEQAILTPKNEMVNRLNEMMMNMTPSEGRTYFSLDSVCKASYNTDEKDMLYPFEFLNSLKFNGVPNHDILLKEGSHVMLLRNFNQSKGLCNDTRLIITCPGKWSIRANTISDTHVGQNVSIPRIIISPNEERWPFK